MTIVGLTIAGSDSGGGAGIQADLKTFAALNVYGTCAITALTAQNTLGVQAIMTVSGDFIAKQISSVMTDFKVAVIKIGMLANREIIIAVSNALSAYRHIPIVLDPVMAATSASRLIEDDAKQTLIDRLIPMSHVITPNNSEVCELLALDPSRQAGEEQAKSLLDMGCNAALITGNKQNTTRSNGLKESQAIDLLVTATYSHRYQSPWIATRNTHGTGCTLSSAIAAYLAHGNPLDKAVEKAKKYVYKALESSVGYPDFTNGPGPVDHFFNRPT